MNPRLDPCNAVEEALPLYVGGDLIPERRRSVDQHLRTCGGCRAAAERARDAREALLEGLRPQARPSIDLWSGVRAGLVQDGLVTPRESAPRAPTSSRQPAVRSYRRAWRYLPLSGVAAAAAVAALWLRVAPPEESPTGGPQVVRPSPGLVSIAPDVAVTPVNDKLRRLSPSDEVWGDRAGDFEQQQAPPGLGLWGSMRNPNLGSPAGYFTPGKTR